VLRDVLRAARRSGRKTRIIGLANLNPSSFARYLKVAIALDLVQTSADGGYRLTPRADAVEASISVMLDRSLEVDASLTSLQHGLSPVPHSVRSDAETFRYVSRIAWNELVRSAALPSSPTTGIDLSRTVPSGGYFGAPDPEAGDIASLPYRIELPAPRGGRRRAGRDRPRG
jgi:hypothetical protein